MITKKILDNQLFVYYNGSMIYKKWLNTNHSIVFEKYGQPTTKLERDESNRTS